MSRIEKEKRFHDKLAEDGFASRRIISRLSTGLYDKDYILRSVWDELGDVGGKVALDYGCGRGFFTAKLSEKGLLVYGIDIARKLIAAAKCNVPGHTKPSPQFYVMDAHNLQFENGFFDFVFGNGILHHLNLDSAYQEIARVLKPGGLAFFTEPLARHPGLRIFRKLTPRARTADERPLSFRDIKAAKKHFTSVQHSEYYLFSVVAAPLNLISLSLAKTVIRNLRRVDSSIFRTFPAARRYAWITLIKLTK